MTINKDILNINKTKKEENTPRLFTNITPVKTIYPILQGKQIIDQSIKEKKQIAFYNDGISAILNTEQEIIDVANAIAMFNYKSRDKSFISDLHTGLYTMLTQGHEFLDIKPTYIEDENGKYLKSVIIYTTKETICKAAFGSLVDNKGQAIRGASSIIDKAKRILMPIINGNIPMPRATATLRKKLESGKYKEIWISGEPIHIFRTTKNLSDTVVLELDAEFTPMRLNEGGKIRATEQYIHSVAGLTAFLQYGKHLTEKENKNNSITSITAKKIILAIQTACELQRITGLGVTRTSSGRTNVTIRRGAIKNIIPEAMRYVGTPNERINWKQASNAVASAGTYFLNAINKTDIWHEIQNNGKIYIPAVEKGMQFPEDFPSAAFIKMDRITK